MKKKKMLPLLLSLIGIGCIIAGICLNNKPIKEKIIDEQPEQYETYTMYVKINPLVKITYERKKDSKIYNEKVKEITSISNIETRH